MPDKNVNIIVSATDATQKALKSVSSGLADIAKQAAGTALGLAGFQGVSNIFGGLTSAVFGMNNSLDATGKQAATMLDSIRNSSASVGTAIQATAKQTENWGRQLRDIRERESDGMANFAQRTRELN